MTHRSSLLRVLILAIALPSAMPSQASGAALPPGVTIQDSVVGKVFADANGRTFYTVTLDLGGDCTHKSSTEFFTVFDCRSRFEPFAAPAEAHAVGDWTVVTRKDDGTRQWAHKGAGVYTYYLDRQSGTVNAEYLYHYGRMARALRAPRIAPAGITSSATDLGEVLADSAGMTLYHTARDRSSGESSCTGRCAVMWRPLPAAAMAGPVGDFLPVTRKDGTRQWAYKQAPLYTYAHDLASGEIKGEGIDGAWNAAVLTPKEPAPPGITIEKTLVGEVYADAQGHTLYGYFGLLANDLAALKNLCGDRCGTIWHAAVAPEGAQYQGSWSLTPLAGGGNQITFKGHPLYIYAEETRRGDILGNRYGRFVWEWMLAVLVDPKDDTTR
jgi:predicted lipoprotein with Yx(FWY)xxD motif